MPYVCDEKTSAAMACCEVKGLGGEDDEELLMEPCINGLLERFEGLVLLGLGPPAMSSFVSRCSGGRVGNKERRWRRGEASRGRRGRRTWLPEASESSEHGGAGAMGEAG